MERFNFLHLVLVCSADTVLLCLPSDSEEYEINQMKNNKKASCLVVYYEPK